MIFKLTMEVMLSAESPHDAERKILILLAQNEAIFTYRSSVEEVNR